MIIPKGTTGKVQPLDVYGFRTRKNYVQHFSDSVILLDYDLNLHIRNNIIKLQSWVHNQLSSPRYHSLFKYSWFKSGYVAENQENLRIQWTFPSKHFPTRYVKLQDVKMSPQLEVHGAKNLCVLNISSKSITTVPRTMNKQV